MLNHTQGCLLCDPLWKNRPLAIFHENHVLGIGQCRIYFRVQRSKSQALKSFLSRVMAKKLYTGHTCFSSQFSEKRSVFYIHSSTFNVSVYAPYHTAWLAILMDLPGKARQAMKKESGKNKHSERYACLYYCLFNSPWA